MSSTEEELAGQWMNPSDVSTILFVLGGDIVQKAFTQGSGKFYVPVCFSFGCAAYAFIGLVGIIGDGRLLSPPDYACKVINLESGYLRESKNFVLGRLLRDMEAIENRKPSVEDDDDYPLRISVFHATFNDRGMTEFSWSRIHLIGLAVTILQFILAVIPVIVNGSWNVILITATGTALVQWIGNLPQWRAEKLPNRQKSSQIYALTSGNGSRDIMVILGYGRCLDLEGLATMPSPRDGRPWEKFIRLSRPRAAYDNGMTRRNTLKRKTKRTTVWPFQGVPIGFMITQATFIVTCVLWLLLLINVSASTALPETWCLLGVGALGMFQNAWLAAAEMAPELRNLPLNLVEVIKGHKVMDVIMDFHETYKCGKPLREEFFPGKLRAEETPRGIFKSEDQLGLISERMFMES
ncbi:hypothetical protein CSOJ01_10488 [Colletotrichum sojae]|uniref:Uncharacterized protein n=1 Tax=Colletotrichum sojae TaxID=2175907 RepID=A0A8H6J0Y7_9PEZI|nr:hypothetical protein CSOJ01_10488 [Colletotrichum sojae]